MHSITINISNEKLVEKVMWFLNLLKKDGLEIIHELKRDFPDIKIIAISGGFMTPDESAVVLQIANEFGAFHVLEKPIEPDQLLDAVQKLLEDLAFCIQPAAW